MTQSFVFPIALLMLASLGQAQQPFFTDDADVTYFTAGTLKARMRWRSSAIVVPQRPPEHPGHKIWFWPVPQLRGRYGLSLPRHL
jgi:hypothetical protein